MTESLAPAVETVERDPIAEVLVTTGEWIKDLTADKAVAPTHWLFFRAISLRGGQLAFAYTAPPEDQEIDRRSEFIVRQLSNKNLPGSRVKEIVAEYRWDATEPENADRQHVTKSDPSGESNLPDRHTGFNDKDAKAIKKLVAKGKKALA